MPRRGADTLERFRQDDANSEMARGSMADAKPTDPFVSICLPTYGRTTYFRQAIESCLNQSYDRYEIVVVDECADDRIKKIVEGYRSNRIVYVHLEPASGLVPKLNDFIRRAKGDWAVVVCDDDIIEPDYLRVLAGLVRKYPKAALVRGRNRLIDEAGHEVRLDRIGPPLVSPDEFLRDLFLPEAMNFKMNITGIMFRPRNLVRLGGFAQTHRAWDVDRIAWAQLGAEGITVCAPEIVSNIRLHPVAVSSDISRDYGAALDTNVKARELFADLLDKMDREATSDAAKHNIAAAKANLGGYAVRQMSRSLDHGFIAALESDAPDVTGIVNELFATLRQLKIPMFPSARIYWLASYLPRPLRVGIIRTLHRAKIARRVRRGGLR